LICEVDPYDHRGDDGQNAQYADLQVKRDAVWRSLEITIESLRERLAQAMSSEEMLDQLYAAIQPDGTIHL
jgi:hypothetical protein